MNAHKLKTERQRKQQHLRSKQITNKQKWKTTGKHIIKETVYVYKWKQTTNNENQNKLILMQNERVCSFCSPYLRTQTDDEHDSLTVNWEAGKRHVM